MTKNFKEKLLKGEFVSQVTEAIQGEIISNPQMIHNIVEPIISYDDDREHFCTLYLNAKNRINHMEISFIGSLSSCSVYPREIMKTALKHKAAAMIFVHNHPSGTLEISNSDIVITKKLVVAACALDITVHDHIIINKTSYLSMASEGLINPMQQAWDDFLQKGFLS
jgi:DNA repair protein RadC